MNRKYNDKGENTCKFHLGYSLPFLITGKKIIMKKQRLLSAMILVVTVAAGLVGCAAAAKPAGKPLGSGKAAPESKIIEDALGRQVEIPALVERVVCLNVGALRYTCYMQAQDRVIAVEDCEKEQVLSRPYNYVNFDYFKDLPVIGTNGNHYTEELIAVNPDVIIMSNYDSNDAQKLQDISGIPVVLVPGSDALMDQDAYETLRIMGEVYGNEERAQELIQYMDQIKKDLNTRTADVPEEEKPSVYVGGVSFKGFHGFEGTEAGYGPLQVINARNLADETGQTAAFSIDLEQVMAWDPDVIFVDFNGMPLIREDYAKHADFYKQLRAVKEERVYSQISFRSNAANLETALADAYYAAVILYPEQFSDVDPEAKATEIFKMFLGNDFYATLKENGYEFRKIQMGEE